MIESNDKIIEELKAKLMAGLSDYMKKPINATTIDTLKAEMTRNLKQLIDDGKIEAPFIPRIEAERDGNKVNVSFYDENGKKIPNIFEYFNPPKLSIIVTVEIKPDDLVECPMCESDCQIHYAERGLDDCEYCNGSGEVTAEKSRLFK